MNFSHRCVVRSAKHIMKRGTHTVRPSLQLEDEFLQLNHLKNEVGFEGFIVLCKADDAGGLTPAKEENEVRRKKPQRYLAFHVV